MPPRGRSLAELERGGIRKKWTGKTPLALVYPNKYAVGLSSLGFQLVYGLLNARDDSVCERFFLPERGERLLSFESQRPLTDFSCIFISVSFEHDYLNVVRILAEGGIEPLAARRRAGGGEGPLVVFGGVAVFMNPEPLAPFADAMIIGEAEAVLDRFVDLLPAPPGASETLLRQAARDLEGVYVPHLYAPRYDAVGRCVAITPEPGVPERIKRVYLESCRRAGHSELYSPQAEFADLHITELGRGCSRGCRFCAAGYIYRPPRLWDADAVLEGLAERPGDVDRLGLLGMEMAHDEVLSGIAAYMTGGGCALSFSSLRADRIGERLLALLADSRLKSVAIAPDGASERLRTVINKGLSRSDLLRAARRLTEAGIYKLKLYVMVGLPGERCEDLQEFIDLVAEMKVEMDGIGRRRGRLTEIHVSANCFVPKAWTPFQYLPFGVCLAEMSSECHSIDQALGSLRQKLGYLKEGVKGLANVHFQADKPETALFQAVLARGDRRLAEVLVDVALRRQPWRSSSKRRGLDIGRLVLCGHGEDTFFPWYIIDNGLDPRYLWRELGRAFRSVATEPCDPSICRRCGVCGER